MSSLTFFIEGLKTAHVLYFKSRNWFLHSVAKRFSCIIPKLNFFTYIYVRENYSYLFYKNSVFKINDSNYIYEILA